MTSSQVTSPLAGLRENVNRQVGLWGHAAVLHGGGPARADAVAALSRLRRASINDLGRMPEVWSAVVDLVPEELRGRSDEPSRAEVAAFSALAMYAVHQQSQDQSVHGVGQSMAAALGQLARGSAHSEAAMTRRFGALLTSESPEEMFHHLRSLVSLLRTAKHADGVRPLAARVDYGRLAGDLYLLLSPRHAPGVRLRWGREFAQFRPEQGVGS